MFCEHTFENIFFKDIVKIGKFFSLELEYVLIFG